MTKQESNKLQIGDRVARKARGRMGGIATVVAANDHAIRLRIDNTDETYIIPRSELTREFEIAQEGK